MTSKDRYRFSLTPEEREFLLSYQTEKGLPYFSDTLRALIADYKALLAKQKEYVQTIKLTRAAARDAHLCLLLLSVSSRDWPHQIFIPKDSELLQRARVYYKSELDAARTKKSNPSRRPPAAAGDDGDAYLDDDMLLDG